MNGRTGLTEFGKKANAAIDEANASIKAAADKLRETCDSIGMGEAPSDYSPAATAERKAKAKPPAAATTASSASPAGAALRALRVGHVVAIDGLTGRPELNGHRGIVIDPRCEADRGAVAAQDAAPGLPFSLKYK